MIYRIIFVILNLLFIQNSYAEIKLVAKVNSDFITTEDINKRYELLKLHNPNIPSKNDVKDAILELLISESIQTQEADKLGLKIIKAELNDRINEITKTNPKISAKNQELIKHLKASQLWVNLVNAKFRADIKVSHKEIENIMQYSSKSSQVDALQFAIAADLYDRKHYQIEDMVKKIKSCKQAKELSANLGIKDYLKINDDIESLNPVVNQILNQAKIGVPSQFINDEHNNKHFFVLCSMKKIKFTKDDEAIIKNMIIEKKLELSAKQYLAELKKKYYIEVKS
jgi:hypothetical protein